MLVTWISSLFLLASIGSVIFDDSKCSLTPEAAAAAASSIKERLSLSGSFEVSTGFSKWFMTFDGLVPDVGITGVNQTGRSGVESK